MPIPPMKSVYSSCISYIGYDEEEGAFYVRWYRTGKLSKYSGVDRITAQQILEAPSVGESVASVLKQGYDHEYV